MIEFIAFVVNPIILILLSFISFPLGEYLKGDCSIKSQSRKSILCCTPCLILIISYICLK